MSKTSTGYNYPQDYMGTKLTYGDPQSVSIGNTSTLLIAANPSRKYLTITNDSDEKMYLAYNTAAVSGKGQILYPGSTFSALGPSITDAAIYAICASGSKTACYIEAT